MSRVLVSEIKRATARSFGIPLADLAGRSAFPQHAHARQMAMYLARELSGYSYPHIGRIFERDHSTIMFGVQQTRRRIVNDRYMAGKASMLLSLFKTAA